MESTGIVSMITLEEIKLAVWSCGNEKVPGPNRFSFSFIKKHWGLLKNDIFVFVIELFYILKFLLGVTLLLLR